MYLPNIYDSHLLNRLRFSMTKRDVVELATAYTETGIKPITLLELCSHPNTTISFHAAWTLESMLLAKPKSLDRLLTTLVQQLPNILGQSAIRHIAKLIAIGIRRINEQQTKKMIGRRFWQMDLDYLEETCFMLLTDENTKAAVKAHSMDILCSLSERSRWIAEELPHIIESQMSMGSPAIQAKCRETIKRMRLTW